MKGLLIMKKAFILVIAALLIVITAVSCTTNTQGDPTPTDIPATEIPVTEAPATEAPTEPPTEPPTEVPEPKISIPYVTDGLAALYEGYFNTKRGQNFETDLWEDLSGNGLDIDFMQDESAIWSDEGLDICATRIDLPDEILDLINGEEFTVEYSVDDLVVTGTNFATLLNVLPNDQFALFIRNANNAIEFKTSPSNSRPQKPGAGIDSVNNKTIAVTFKLHDKIRIYSDGVLLSEVDARSTLEAVGTFFIGHNDANKSYDATIRSLRFYNRALTAEELVANAQAVGTLKAES